jgi:hypothetical protein
MIISSWVFTNCDNFVYILDIVSAKNERPSCLTMMCLFTLLAEIIAKDIHDLMHLASLLKKI